MSKKVIPIVAALSLAWIGCGGSQTPAETADNDGPVEEAGEEVDQAAETVGEGAEEAVDETGDAMGEAGEAVDDATEDDD